MINAETFLQNIAAGVDVDKAFFLKMYGYSITRPDFLEKAFRALNDAGFHNARSSYQSVVDEYENARDEKIKPVAEWLRDKIDKEFDSKVENFNRKQGEEKRKRQLIQNLTKRELTELCKKLLAEGIITTPEQLATALAEQGL